MTFRKLKLNQKGYTLIELAVATAVMAVLATTVVIANQFVNKQGVANADRTFATEKAIQMYEELRTLVSGNEGVGAGVLNNYSNGDNFDQVLTTDPNVDTGLATANPGDPLSGNFKSDGHWRYMRQVEVDPVANDTQARQVTVKVYLYPGDYATLSSPITQTGTLLATVGGILRTSQQPNVPTQVLDIYILQIDNIPSWWSVLPTLAGNMQAAVSDLKSRLNGYQIRVHYVTRTSFGRDSQYQPETNSFANPTDTTHQQWTYFYPGISPQDGTEGESWYYDPLTSGDPNSLLMTGNFMVDGASYPVSTSLFDNDESVNFSVADQYNNAMRYPDEMVAYQAVTAAAVADANTNGVSINEAVTEITERMLLEGMLSQPASFANSIIINMHGELLPIPPLRNYSDAAKDPGNQLASCAVTNGVAVTCAIPAANGVTGDMNVRVVTHPELLYYPVSVSGATTATAVTVRLRVYAYYDSEGVGGSNGLPTGDPRVPAISLFLPDACATITGVTAIVGSSTVTYGYEPASTGLPSAPPAAWTSSIPRDSSPMSMSVSYIGPGNKQTLITLYNTPLRCPIYATGSKGGLNPADMLYGTEYIPCSPDQVFGSGSLMTATSYNANSYNFGNDLGNDNATTVVNTPKNTARWIISLAMPVTQTFPGPVTIGIYSGGITSTTATGFTVAGIHAIETRLGNGVTSSTFLTSTNAPVTVIPNLSRTYVWTGDAFMPPYTEQYQFLGDPRDCPYYDVKVGGVSITGAAVTIGPNAYNWWFKGNGTANMTTDGYAGFGQAGTSIWSGDGGGDLNIDLPRYYQLIRQGLLSTTSIWTGTNGWSWFYFGIGGEYGSDQGPRSNGISMIDDLFDQTPGGVVGNFNAIYSGDGKDGTHGKGLFVISNTTGSHSVTWYQRSWLGEIYPDQAYLGSWVTYGNLPSVKNSTLTGAVTTVTGNFYCEPMETVAVPASNPSDDGFNDTFWPNPAGYGSESFYDGKNTTTGKTFVHDGTDNNGNELQLAVTTYNIFPFPLPGVVDVNREWEFNGGTTPESAFAPYNSAAMTTTLDIPTVTSHNGSDGVTSRLFYDYNGNGATAPYGSGVVRMTQVNTVPATPVTQVGYVIETGTAPSTAIGPQTLAETALVLSMRTFLDGGQMAATNVIGHIVQLPLVRIFLASAVPEYNEAQTIAFTVASPVTATTNGGGAVSVGMPVTDIWWAYNPNGLASYYTEEYPQYSLAGGMTEQTGNYQESVSVIYNLKYSTTQQNAVGGNTWYFVQDGAAAVSGICDCATANHAVTNIAPWTYTNWAVATGSGGSPLPQGSYQLMVEAYRQGHGEHYSYDIQDFTVSY